MAVGYFVYQFAVKKGNEYTFPSTINIATALVFRNGVMQSSNNNDYKFDFPNHKIIFIWDVESTDYIEFRVFI